MNWHFLASLALTLEPQNPKLDPERVISKHNQKLMDELALIHH